MQLKVKVMGVEGIKKKLKEMSEELRDRALSASINKVGAKAKSEMIRAITDEFNIKRGDVSSKIRLSRASRGHLEVFLDPFASGRKGRALNLIHFFDKKTTITAQRKANREKKRSSGNAHGKEMPLLYFRIKKNEPSKPIPGAFIGNQGRTVFIRVGNGRLPIKPLSTIGIPQMFNTKRISQRVMARINKELPVEIDRAIKMVMERYGK